MTSKTENLFAWIWRINGLLVLVVAILCIVGLVAIFADEGVFGKREGPRDQLIDVAGTDLAAEELRLGGFRTIDGTDYIYATLAAPSRYIGSGSSWGNDRNWLFFNTESRKAHWLFPDSSQEIAGQRFLYQYSDDEAESDEDSEAILVGVLMTLADVHGEDVPEQPKRLILVSADGKTTTVLAEVVDGLLHNYHVSSTSHLVFYSQRGSVHIMEFDPTTAAVVSDTVLSADR